MDSEVKRKCNCNARHVDAQQKECPAEAGLEGLADLMVELVADHPAVPIWAADLMRTSASAWSYRSHDYRGAPIATAIVAVGATSAIRTTMKADATSASDLNDQTVLRLIAKRHGFGGNC